MQNLLERIEVLKGDITKMEVDAIVNAANTSLLGGGGVDGAIHRGAGPELLEECRKLKGCPTGEAKMTKGYRLPAKCVIHTVGPVYGNRQKDSALLAACYRNCMKLAEDADLTSVAFPAVSCGVYGYPIEEACQIAVDTVLEALKGSLGIQKIFFVLFSESDKRVYQDYINKLRG